MFLAYFGMTLGGSGEMGGIGSALIMDGTFLVGGFAPLPCILPLRFHGVSWCFSLPPLPPRFELDRPRFSAFYSLPLCVRLVLSFAWVLFVFR